MNNGLKKYENEVQKFKPVTRTLCLIGSGAVMGVGTKLGWNETGKLLKKVMANPTVIKGKKISPGLVKKFQHQLKSLEMKNLPKLQSGLRF